MENLAVIIALNHSQSFQPVFHPVEETNKKVLHQPKSYVFPKTMTSVLSTALGQRPKIHIHIKQFTLTYLDLPLFYCLFVKKLLSSWKILL